jgi:putative membrane protein
MTFRLAIVVTAAVVLALVGTAAVTSASNTVDKDVAQTTIGKTTAPDTLPPGGMASPTLAALQPMDDGGGEFNIWWIVGPMMMFIFWGGIIAVFVWGVRQFTGARDRDRSPLDIAKERLARGEISKEEFDRIRGDLT